MRAETSHRVAVITGAAAGIGQAIAVRLAADGMAVALLDIGPTDETAALITAAGGRCVGVHCDIGDAKSVIDAVEVVVSELGRADVLINNAAQKYPRASFADTDEQLFTERMNINLTGTFRMCKAVVPHMVEQGWGRVINVSSTTVFVPVRDVFAYATSKAAVIGLTRSLATEVGPAGVTVNAIAPGMVTTPSTVETLGAEAFADVARLQPIGRNLSADDIVGTISFLASDDAGFITGQTIAVDGGWARL